MIDSEIEANLAQQIIDSIKSDYSLASCDSNYLFGIAKKGIQIKEREKLRTVYGFFYVNELNRDTYRSILQEAKLHHIQAPYQIYGRFEVFQSPNVCFVNVQDWRKILRQKI